MVVVEDGGCTGEEMTQQNRLVFSEQFCLHALYEKHSILSLFTLATVS